MALTAERAREVLSYEPSTGALRWKVRMGSRAPAGGLIDKACKKSGYINIRIDGIAYRAHRVIWLMVTGVWTLQVDHKNRNKADNRLDNLRETCDALNRQNVEKARKDSITGLQGVRVDARRPGRFNAVIKRDGKHLWLGSYDTPEEAHAAYLNAKAQLHTAWVPSADALNQVEMTDNHLLIERGLRRVRCDSKTGFPGVGKFGGKWRAKFKKRHLGMFDSPQIAHAAYMAARAAELALQAR